MLHYEAAYYINTSYAYGMDKYHGVDRNGRQHTWLKLYFWERDAETTPRTPLRPPKDSAHFATFVGLKTQYLTPCFPHIHTLISFSPNRTFLLFSSHAFSLVSQSSKCSASHSFSHLKFSKSNRSIFKHPGARRLRPRALTLEHSHFANSSTRFTKYIGTILLHDDADRTHV